MQLKKYILLYFASLTILCEAATTLSNETAFFKQIHSAYTEFQYKDRTARCYRYLCYGLLGAGFSLAVFRNASPSRMQEQWMFDKVRELAHEQTPTVQPTRGFFKSMLYGTAALTAGVFGSFIRDGLLGNLAYGLISPILEPIHRFMNSHRTLLSGDVWFLREQVRESHAPFVLVSMDLSNFVDELKTWELEVHHYMLLLGTPANDPIITDELFAATQQRICVRLSRILGHIMYMRDKASQFEQLTLKVLYNTLQHYLELSMNTWLNACRNDDYAVKQQATETFEKSIKRTLLPLLSVSLYRIHPWPASVACSDYARLCVTSVVAGYGNPIVQ